MGIPATGQRARPEVCPQAATERRQARCWPAGSDHSSLSFPIDTARGHLRSAADMQAGAQGPAPGRPTAGPVGTSRPLLLNLPACGPRRCFHTACPATHTVLGKDVTTARTSQPHVQMVTRIPARRRLRQLLRDATDEETGARAPHFLRVNPQWPDHGGGEARPRGGPGSAPVWSLPSDPPLPHKGHL